MSGAIQALVKQLGFSRRISEEMAVVRWPEVVGETINRNARPFAVRRGVLVVQVCDPAWATQLGFMKKDLIDRLNLHLGGRVINDIHWVSGVFPGGTAIRTLKRLPYKPGRVRWEGEK